MEERVENWERRTQERTRVRKALGLQEGAACDLSHYSWLSVPQSVWVKTGALQWWCNWKPHKWVDVRVALEQFTGHDGARDSILFIYYMVHEEKKVQGGMH